MTGLIFTIDMTNVNGDLHSYTTQHLEDAIEFLQDHTHEGNLVSMDVTVDGGEDTYKLLDLLVKDAEHDS